MNPDRSYLLGELLKNVSRSFYLTIRVLPEGLREPIGLAYLLARAADTIADTQLVPPPKRLELLLSFRAQVQATGAVSTERLDEIRAAVTGEQTHPHEKILLESLTPALAILTSLSDFDREQVQHVVTILTEGMEFDLATFPDETSGKLAALNSVAELERYTYLVAGCVGDFWTRMLVAHTHAFSGLDIPELCERGIRFGKALQYTNVLRDCPKDLRAGRCYLPLEVLNKFGVAPSELLDPQNSTRVRPALAMLMTLALEHFREATRYTLTIPPSYSRLRLACLWPVLIGLETLLKLSRNAQWLDRAHPSKITRKHVYRLVAASLPTVGSDTAVTTWVEWRLRKIERELQSL